jgi:hypothetical protein
MPSPESLRARRLSAAAGHRCECVEADPRVLNSVFGRPRRGRRPPLPIRTCTTSHSILPIAVLRLSIRAAQRISPALLFPHFVQMGCGASSDAAVADASSAASRARGSTTNPKHSSRVLASPPPPPPVHAAQPIVQQDGAVIDPTELLRRSKALMAAAEATMVSGASAGGGLRSPQHGNTNTSAKSAAVLRREQDEAEHRAAEQALKEADELLFSERANDGKIGTLFCVRLLETRVSDL